MPIRAPQYPSAVGVTNTYLRTALVAAGQVVPVVSRVPNPRPVKFVRVSRTGGPEVFRGLDGAQVTIDCWAATASDAEDLGLLCRRLVHNMAGTVQSGTSVHKVDEFGFAPDLADPDSDTPMATLTVQIQMRGAAA